VDRPFADTLVLDVAGDKSAPGIVREALRTIDAISHVIDDALLVASELVGNVLRQPGRVAETQLHVRASVDEHGLLISVHAPVIANAGAYQDGSGQGDLGLQIVERLAERWDITHDDRYRAWARLTLE